MQYLIYRKDSFDPDDSTLLDVRYDLLLYSLDANQRGNFIPEKVNSTKYVRFDHAEIETSPSTTFKQPNRSEVIKQNNYHLIHDIISSESNSNSRIAVDMTGMLPCVFLSVIHKLKIMQIKKFDVFYVEPQRYVNRDCTDFRSGNLEITTIPGFSGNHLPEMSDDFLIVGSGYDWELIASVATQKSNAKKIQLIGFPSLSAHMYQENVMRSAEAAERVGKESEDLFFSPAYDPFVTASTLNEIVTKNPSATNIYLSPLSTKPQCLGFGLYYLLENHTIPTSILLPLSEKYPGQTTHGVKRIWKYTVEF